MCQVRRRAKVVSRSDLLGMRHRNCSLEKDCALLPRSPRALTWTLAYTGWSRMPAATEGQPELEGKECQGDQTNVSSTRSPKPIRPPPDASFDTPGSRVFRTSPSTRAHLSAYPSLYDGHIFDTGDVARRCPPSSGAFSFALVLFERRAPDDNVGRRYCCKKAENIFRFRAFRNTEHTHCRMPLAFWAQPAIHRVVACGRYKRLLLQHPVVLEMRRRQVAVSSMGLLP
jgi:hypothetical protein